MSPVKRALILIVGCFALVPPALIAFVAYVNWLAKLMGVPLR